MSLIALALGVMLVQPSSGDEPYIESTVLMVSSPEACERWKSSVGAAKKRLGALPNGDVILWRKFTCALEDGQKLSERAIALD